ncbi:MULTISPECIES: hypothetical protein [Mycobacteroides]|uniref:hypothetical protein n=1 Tax=Mycobacteroides TaxID=670516 RepID=UPI0009BCF8E5|nr:MULTISPECIES: hypothetical protein [Mycobacteroides]WJR34125.1 hypothetical protein P3F83_01340 [Mycobacteroides immunogenum]SKU12397.1 Uncharacterised protein [Mycobacteroides abscessus subsp. massiliense]
MMKSLAVLALTFGVGASTIGCSGASTPTAPLSSTISTSAAHEMVDVSAVWQTEPLPDCPKPPIVFNGSVPPGLSLPDKASVARQLAGVKSPASEEWVRTKLGWVTQELAATRADLISDPGVGAKEQSEMFVEWVTHVREELRDGHDIASDLDGAFPEGCA